MIARLHIRTFPSAETMIYRIIGPCSTGHTHRLVIATVVREPTCAYTIYKPNFGARPLPLREHTGNHDFAGPSDLGMPAPPQASTKAQSAAPFSSDDVAYTHPVDFTSDRLALFAYTLDVRIIVHIVMLLSVAPPILPHE